ncbi:MAG: hypothetical protein P8I25_07815 [Ilumatobacter sp.]|nr:hypothetical protein [Ilumatobacter sp.]
MSSSRFVAKGSVSSLTDGSMTWNMKTPSPGWAVIPTHPSVADADADADAEFGRSHRHE